MESLKISNRFIMFLDFDSVDKVEVNEINSNIIIVSIRMSGKIPIKWYDLFYSSFKQNKDMIVADAKFTLISNTNIIRIEFANIEQIKVSCEVLKRARDSSNAEYKKYLDDRENEIYRLVNELLFD